MKNKDEYPSLGQRGYRATVCGFKQALCRVKACFDVLMQIQAGLNWSERSGPIIQSGMAKGIDVVYTLSIPFSRSRSCPKKPCSP